MQRAHVRTRRLFFCSRTSVTFTVFTFLLVCFTALWPHSHIGAARSSTGALAGSDTVVLYIHRQTDAESASNLAYFLDHVGHSGDLARYIVAVDPRIGEKETQQFSNLPDTIEFYRPKQLCFELGTVGEVFFNSGKVALSQYKYFIWADSSARGPFVPGYVQGPWHGLLTSYLTGATKLVGATISCAGLKTADEPGWIQSPHVQGFLMATDRQGLKLMRANNVFGCHQTWAGHLRHGEYAASQTLLGKGYNIGSLMARYQGLDWRDPSKAGCNAMLDPLLDGHYDGSSLQPYEVVFVPMQQPLLGMKGQAATQAAALTAWSQEDRSAGSSQVTSNAWTGRVAGALQELQGKSIDCFDSEVYIQSSPSEFAGWTAQQAWQHFLDFGFKEGRPYRLLC